jgi:carbonic anhydrase/acetyltransferase-like protein (isoleucine patch superfamily)
MTTYLLIGEGDALLHARLTANEMGLDYVEIALDSNDRHNFDLAPVFENYQPDSTKVFVALDERAVNFARYQLVSQVRLAGYQLINIISPTAVVGADVRLLGNVYIGPRCTVADDVSIGVGSWLSSQVTVDREVQLGSCVTLHPGVVLGRKVKIGTGSTLSSGSFAANETQIGRHCEWLLGGRIPATLPDRSFFDDLMPEGARIFRNA